MVAISLEDQMGAMSIIDGLRHQQRVVRDLIDLPQRRREVAARLQAYYTQKGIDVDQETIDAGVKAYFDKRLEFTVPQTSRFQDAWASVYMKRDAWMKPVAIGVIAVTLLGSGSVWITSELAAREVAAQQMQQQRARETLAALLERTRTYQTEFHADTQAPERLVTTVRAQIGELLPQLKDTDSASPELHQNVGVLAQRLTVIEEGRGGIRAVREALPLLARAEASDEAALRQRALDLRAQLDGIDTAIQADLFVNEARALDRSVTTLPQLRTFARDRDATLAAFAKMKLSDAGEQHVAGVAQQVTDAIEAFDAQRAERAVKALQALFDYAKTPVKFEIASRAGVKSGVERTAHEGGGKAWYIIVEATQPTGRSIDVPVTSAETRTQTRTSLFGVRVTQAKYEQVKADKLDDGHVDDRKMGEKRADSLDMEFTAALTRPDGGVNLITEW